MKPRNLLFPLLALLVLSSQGFGANISPDITTSFSNMQGSSGEDSSVVYSDTTGSPILKGTGYIAIGTFNLSREQIAALANAEALEAAFHQFGSRVNFNALEDGAFQGNASGNPSELYDGNNSFLGSSIYVVIGNGESLGSSSEFLVWDSGTVFDNSGPTGNSWEVFLSAGSGDLIIGLDDKNTSDFSSIGGDSQQAAFTTVKIDSTLDDHGNSREYASTILENSSTSGIIADGDDVDFFRVQLSDDGSLSIRVVGSFNVQLALYDSQGAQVASGQAVEGGFDIITDLPAGTYYVSVGGDANTNSEDYSLETAFQVKIIDLDPDAAGIYHGLVIGQNDKFIGHLSIYVASNGYYSGRLRGIYGFSQWLKGNIQPDYSALADTNNVYGDKSTTGFNLSKNQWGTYFIEGDFRPLSENEPAHHYRLRPPAYNKNARVPARLGGRYTYRLGSSTLSKVNIPAGDGIGGGILWSGGWLKLNGRSNTGSKFTYGSPVLRGDLVPFYTLPSIGIETIMGYLWFRDRETTDLRGAVRYLRTKSNIGYYTDSFDETLLLEGSRYIVPGPTSLPLDNYRLTEANARAEFTGGDFNGLIYPVTWKPISDTLESNLITPAQPGYEAWGAVYHKWGSFWGYLNAYPLADSSDTSSPVQTYYRGVVLQKQGIVTGQAETVGGAVGRYTLVPAP